MQETEKFWKNGYTLARFEVRTGGPERFWAVEMRSCEESGKKYVVVLDPFGERFMWFDSDMPGVSMAQMAFTHLVGIAMCDVALPVKAEKKEEQKNGK